MLIECSVWHIDNRKFVYDPNNAVDRYIICVCQSKSKNGFILTNIRKYLTAYHWSMFTLSIFVMIGIFAPLLANELPLACKTPDGWIFPALLTKDRPVYSSKNATR